MTFPLNQRVLVSDATYLEPKGINAFENPDDQPNRAVAVQEHTACVDGFKKAGIKVEQVASPKDCQDGVFTANWGLTWNGRALLSNLPDARKAEEPVAEATLQRLGFETKRASVLFSGQGDAMIIGGNRVLIGGGYRTDMAVAAEIREWLGLDVIQAKAQPKKTWYRRPVRNRVTGLWDSYYYDIDLAIAVIRPNLLAVCLGGLTSSGRAAIRGLRDVEIIEVSVYEARYGLACNLVSTGETVVMSDSAPKLASELRQRGLNLITLSNHELRKSGGGFRCSSLSLYS